jgi:hypothetical protein
VNIACDDGISLPTPISLVKYTLDDQISIMTNFQLCFSQAAAPGRVPDMSKLLGSSPVLHTAAILENDRGHVDSCIGVGDELSVKVSNTKDEAWSKHKHLCD